MFDVIVLGGGPAGSVFASLVKRADPKRRVLVLEKSNFPRHHVGESLIAGIAPVLARAGVLERLEELAQEPSGVLRKAGIAYWWGDNESEGWTTDFRDPETGRPVIGTYQVDRAAFDALLLNHARSLGAEVIEGARVTKIEPRWKVSYELDGQRHTAESPLIVDASGLARLMGRAQGIDVLPFDTMSNFAVYGYWDGSDAYTEGQPTGERDRWTFVSTTELGWVWHIPLEGTRASVGLVTTQQALREADDLDAFYREQVGRAKTAGLLRQATLDSELRVVRDWSSGLAQVCGEGWLAIGDAAGFVDPILTSGMLLAITGASLAASFARTLWSGVEDEALLRTSYDETVRDLLQQYHRLAHIWYRRNDKVESWWWEARQQAQRGTIATDERRAFLVASLGLAKDPYAAAAEQHLKFEPVRPDKELFAHRLFGGWGEQLTRLTAVDTGEHDARAEVYARLMQRWRELLDSDVGLVPLETNVRERFYCDRTMSGWKRARFLELSRTDAFLERVVLPASDLVELLEQPGTLRERLWSRIEAGTTAGREDAKRIWRQVVQLDMRGWLDSASGSASGSASDTDFTRWVRTLAPTTKAFEVDLLGRELTLYLEDAPTLELVFAPIERCWKRVGDIALSYRGELYAQDVLEGIAERLKPNTLPAGLCAQLDGRFVPAVPDQLRSEFRS